MEPTLTLSPYALAINEPDSPGELLRILAHTLQCQVACIGGPRPMVASGYGQEHESLGLMDFPQALLDKLNRIAVVREIADRDPMLYGTMRQYRVGAIVPFTAHDGASPRWMLLGDRGGRDYTPLDFKMIEDVFAAMADRFPDGFMPAPPDTAAADTELADCKRRLALAWAKNDEMHRQLSDLRQLADTHERHAVMYENELRKAREELARLRREHLQVVRAGLPSEIATGAKTLNQYVENVEADLIRKALHLTRGSVDKASRLLGVEDMRTLQSAMERHLIDPDEYS